MRKTKLLLVLFAGILIIGGLAMSVKLNGGETQAPAAKTEESVSSADIKLPSPKTEGKVSVEETLLKRRSVRNYEDKALTLKQLSQLLWAAQGITNERGFRTAPSAGALYPVNTYILIGKAEGASAGLYRYIPSSHSLEKIKDGDLRGALQNACLNQRWVGAAPVSLILTAVYGRITPRYGERGKKYTHIEIGHIAQNFSLQAAALGLATVPVGAFKDSELQNIIGSDAGEPVYVIPAGYPAR